METSKVKTLAAALLVAHTNVLDRLGTWKGGFAVVVMTFAAGAGFQSTLGQFIGRTSEHETRITELEEWQETHEDSVSNPIVRQIGTIATSQQDLRARQDSTFRQLDNIETLMWCGLNQILACPATNPRPPVRR